MVEDVAGDLDVELGNAFVTVKYLCNGQVGVKDLRMIDAICNSLI